MEHITVKCEKCGNTSGYFPKTVRLLSHDCNHCGGKEKEISRENIIFSLHSWLDKEDLL